jgi:hypothetical protein
MSIETLNSAARAAGFAMAASEGAEEEERAETVQGAAWQSEAALLLRTESPIPAQAPAKDSFSLGEWVKGFFTLGRGAPA